MSLPQRVYFTMIFPRMPEPVVEVWKCLTDFLGSSQALPKQFQLQQITAHPEHLQSEQRLLLSPQEVGAVIAERALTGFFVDTGYGESSISFGLREIGDQRVGDPEWAYFDCRIERGAKAPNDWTPLIETLSQRWPPVGAWQFMVGYQAWQWASVKHELYEERNGPFPPGFTTYPDPNYPGIGERKTLIDVSRNPGRPRSFRPDGAFLKFYPTAEMWLGPHFWQHAKCTREEALAADFFIEKRDTPHHLYLKCWPQFFTRPDGEQGRMQQRLWKLFFHEDCEWPPGSGIISDDPMYGPPELMPDYHQRQMQAHLENKRKP